jgi:hypothetical protein
MVNALALRIVKKTFNATSLSGRLHGCGSMGHSETQAGMPLNPSRGNGRETIMRRVLMMTLASAAIATATPAYATVTVVGPAATVSSCANFAFNVPPTEMSCAGGYTGNLIQGTLQSPGLTAIQALGYSGTGAYLSTIPTISTGTATIDFGQTLFGLTIIGLHYGSAGDGGEGTSFFLFDAGTAGVGSVTVSSRTDTHFNFGLSNAALFSTGGPVPEPATWAMMLLGFGGIGMAMRRSRRGKPALAQIA